MDGFRAHQNHHQQDISDHSVAEHSLDQLLSDPSPSPTPNSSSSYLDNHRNSDHSHLSGEFRRNIPISTSFITYCPPNAPCHNTAEHGSLRSGLPFTHGLEYHQTDCSTTTDSEERVDTRERRYVHDETASAMPENSGYALQTHPNRPWAPPDLPSYRTLPPQLRQTTDRIDGSSDIGDQGGAPQHVEYNGLGGNYALGVGYELDARIKGHGNQLEESLRGRDGGSDDDCQEALAQGSSSSRIGINDWLRREKARKKLARETQEAMIGVNARGELVTRGGRKKRIGLRWCQGLLAIVVAAVVICASWASSYSRTQL